MKKPFVLWILAIIITLGAAYYQRKTGPTHKYVHHFTLDGRAYKISLPRSHETDSDCEISLEVPGEISGKIVYRRYPTSGKWTEVQMTEITDGLSGLLPAQPAAGKLEYFVVLDKESTNINLPSSNPVVIRFKGRVPLGILLPHILLMFLTMLFAT